MPQRRRDAVSHSPAPTSQGHRPGTCNDLGFIRFPRASRCPHSPLHLPFLSNPGVLGYAGNLLAKPRTDVITYILSPRATRMLSPVACGLLILVSVVKKHSYR